MGPDILLKCSYCIYTSSRKYNLDRHEINKHSKEILNKEKIIKTEQKTIPNEINNEHNTVPCIINNEENTIPKQNILSCLKCYKEYLTIKYLKNHEKKCIGIDILTCPKCMIHFSNSGNKSRHIKRNTCKSKSIIHARQPTNTQNTQNIQNIETQNIITNNDNRVINNKNIFIINNYGNERLDYLSDDDMLKILQSGDKTISLYIEQKHFNKEFPENNNVLYDTKSKKCKFKENDKWTKMNLSMASSKLITDNSSSLLNYFDINKDILNKKIKNEEIYDHILNKLLFIKYKSNKEKYNNLFNIIRFMIEGSDNLFDDNEQSNIIT